MEKEIESAIRAAYNKYLVKHVPIKNDARCRTEIMFEEATREIMKLIKNAPLAELADAPDLGSGAARFVGSTPTGSTNESAKDI